MTSLLQLGKSLSWMRLSLFLAALTLAGVLGGCAAGDDFGDAAENVGDAVENVGEGVSDAVDDAVD